MLMTLRWSFGGNRLQIKAETHLLADLQLALEKVVHVGFSSSGSKKSLNAKQELLSLLVASEQTRLMVWLFPLDYDKKHHFTSSQHSRPPTDVGCLPYITSGKC
jgi:phosphatidylinositol 4-kinase